MRMNCLFRLGAAGLIIGFIGLPDAFAQTAFRAFWADAFHQGFKSTAQIDTMVSRARSGNYNAIIAEVLAYQDTTGGGHGAYWNSSIVPKALDISGGIDPLAYLCQKAHSEGIEVHAWLVTYRVSTAWPPAGNATIAAHPEWITVPLAGMGSGPSTIDGKYILDAGCPEVQEYLISIVRELVTNYPIDGINWDYIRYTQTDAGYPSNSSFTKSGLARFQAITGFAGTPPVSNTSWSDFRRRCINELVRRCRAEIPAITSNPRQPLRHTADLICSGNAPSNFTSSDAYNLYQNWQHWLQMGWLDAGIPMNYKDERNATHAQWYRNWVSFAITWRGNRHVYCGQGNYLNSKANSVTQLQYVYAQGANGSANYSYYSTADENDDGTEEADFTWYPYVAANIFTSPAALPMMPWRNPATATEGTLWGRVTALAGGGPIDDATVQAGAFPSVQTDGNGYFTVTLIPATAGGTSYSVTASKAGYPPFTVNGVQVFAGGLARQDFALGAPTPPVIAEVSPDPYPAVTGTPFTLQLGLTQGAADAWTLLAAPPGAVISSSGFVSGWTPGPADVGQLRTFTARASNGGGFDDETWQVSVSAAPPCNATLLSGFEGYANNAEVMFRQPSFSGSTSQHMAGSPAPNVRAVTDEVTPFAGIKCYKLSWQWLDGATTRWLRATTSNAANVPNPTVELDKPIRIRLRIDSGALLVSIGIRETGTTAAVGANGGTTGDIERVGATHMEGSAPQGRFMPARPGVWQTLIFDPARDPVLPFTGNGALGAPNNKGTLEHIAFASTGTAGPFTVYLDSIEQLCEFPPTPPADLDRDGDVDGADLEIFRACALGAEVPQADPACLGARLDADDDVDPDDFGLFQRCVSGMNLPARPDCAD